MKQIKLKALYSFYPIILFWTLKLNDITALSVYVLISNDINPVFLILVFLGLLMPQNVKQAPMLL